MARTKFYSIKFPLTAESRYKTCFDLNLTPYESIKSDIIHLLFTPTGIRLRKPEYGSNLLKLLFNPNDDISYEQILEEIQTVVNRWIPSVKFNGLIVTPKEDGYGVTVKMDYDVNEASFSVRDTIEIDL